jgi:ergothioneine biosynthesis protein EgtC
MCRFALYLGEAVTVSSLLTEPTHSIVKQSYQSREREEPLNGDGFGIAWYAPEMSREPALFRDISPAWNNQNLANLARVVSTRCLLAHVRAASPGLPVTRLNCHPFAWENLAFMHNGVIGGFRHLRRGLMARLSDEAFHVVAGSTDSECLFALLVDAYLARGRPVLNATVLAELLMESMGIVESARREAGVDEPSSLNLAITDGRHAALTRFTSDDQVQAESLYYHSGRRYVCEQGMCRMVEPDVGEGAVIVASERLSSDPGWSPVPPNHLITVDADLGVGINALSL